MSSDPYEDLTDEEKALLKREMKHRIEQQRARERGEQDQLPGIIAGSALVPLSVGALVASDSIGMFLLMLTISIFMILFAVGLASRQRIKGDNSKNKRG